MKQLFFVLFVFLSAYSKSQNWEAFTDSIATLSSPRSSDLNGDGIMDIVIGGGTDSVFSENGIMAYNGVDGSLLWKRPSRDEVFGSAVFQDITSDGINDIIISGRSAQLLAIDGLNGTLLWDYFPYNTNPADSGLYNFYNPQFIDDVDGDTYPDILVSNGGDHSAPAWQSNRPPGSLMVISSLTGNLIVKAIVPDSSETYCSPIVADIQNTGNKWVLYGTGGENFGGNFYAVLLDDLLLGDLSSSIILSSDLNKGFIAPATIHETDNGMYDIIIQSFDGLITKIDGLTFSSLWTYQIPGTESSAQPVIGNFTGDLTPDILLVLFKGIAPSYNDYYQLMLDGSNGTVQFIDSLGAINYASANSVDLNNDGRDEGIYLITYLDSGYFKSRVESVDFTTNTITTIDQERTGVNISSTPLITDLDNDGLLDLVYSVKKDSLNPMGWKGINVYRNELNSIIPNSGIAWGSYLGTNMNGAYNSELIECGNGSVISSVNIANPSCNGFSDGNISINVVGDSSSYTYLWSNQSTSYSINNLLAGSYWVQVTDSTGCTEMRSVNLFDPFLISFGGITPPTCYGDSNGIATLSSSGCPCMFSTCTYLWENGVTTKTNPSLPVGWSSVIITHANGCIVVDSVLISTSLFNSDTTSTSVTTCNSYMWDSVTYNQSGIYSNVYTNVRGCDSTHFLNLTINSSDSIVSNVTACDTFYWDGVFYTASGLYTNIYVNSTGCDSVHTLDLVINYSESSSSVVIACDSYTLDGVTYTQSGVYTNIYTNIEGCDSSAVLYLTINEGGCVDILACNYNPLAICDDGSCLYPSSNNNIITACDSYIWDGVSYTTSGAYTNVYTNVVGCDSTHTLNLTINYSNTGFSTVTTCDSLVWDGVAYTVSGVYTNFYTNLGGCDSVHTLDLTINSTPSSSSTVTACSSYIWDNSTIGGLSTTYTMSGIYTEYIIPPVGCAHTDTLNLTIVTLDATLSQSGNDLTVNILGGTSPYLYSWSTGSSSEYISPIANGDYWVIVEDVNGCISDTVFYTVTWVPSFVRDLNLEKLNVFPNPSTSLFNLEFISLVNQDLRIRLINTIGKDILLDDLQYFIGEYTTQIDLTNHSKGVYFLEIQLENGFIYKKLILQ